MDDDFEIIDAPAMQATEDLSIRANVNDQLEGIPTLEAERSIDPLNAAMQATAKEASKDGPIFFADLGVEKDLIYNTWREGVPEEDRGVFNCSACRRFLRRYGNLCTITSVGALQPLFWQSGASVFPQYFKKPVINIANLFEGKTVAQVFKTEEPCPFIFGTCRSPRDYRSHFSVTLTKLPPSARNFVASQDAGTLYTMLNRVIEENCLDVITKAHHMIHDGQLPYATSHEAPISYLNGVAKKLAEQKLNIVSRRNLITKFALEAFPGCISSLCGGMLGYLLECIREGQDFPTLLHNWRNKADPHSYLRPIAAPSEGNVRDAEKIFAKLGYNSYDLERVYLTLDQVPENGIMWSPKPAIVSELAKSSEKPSTAPGQIFGKLLMKASEVKNTVDLWDTPIIDISFRRFAERILPNVASMELDVAPRLFMYFFTNGKENSKPLMSFSSKTNLASWYVWGSECSPERASMKAGWAKVNSVVALPHMWENISPMDALDDEKVEAFKHKRHGIRYLFCLEGAREINPECLCLFPTLIKSEFHSVRQTVEAFSREGRIEYPAGGKAHVGGVIISKEGVGKREVLVRINTHAGQMSKYKITLFD